MTRRTAVGDSDTVAEDSGASAIDVLANDTDIDGGPLSIVGKTNGSHGTVALIGAGAGLTYTPASDYCGPDSFTYTLNSGSTATVSVTVSCVDDAPSAADDSATLIEDASATAIDVLANDTDGDGGPKIDFLQDQRLSRHGGARERWQRADLCPRPQLLRDRCLHLHPERRLDSRPSW